MNRIQSVAYPSAFLGDENILLCAPKGTGKTNVALLTVLRTISQFRNETTDRIELDSFKVVYIGPMKALVKEIVGNFSN